MARYKVMIKPRNAAGPVRQRRACYICEKYFFIELLHTLVLPEVNALCSLCHSCGKMLIEARNVYYNDVEPNLSKEQAQLQKTLKLGEGKFSKFRRLTQVIKPVVEQSSEEIRAFAAADDMGNLLETLSNVIAELNLDASSSTTDAASSSGEPSTDPTESPTGSDPERDD